MLVIGSEEEIMPLKVHGDGPPLIGTLQSLSGVLENRMAASVKAVLTCTLVIIGYGTITHVLDLDTISVKERTLFYHIFLKNNCISIIYIKKKKKSFGILSLFYIYLYFKTMPLISINKMKTKNTKLVEQLENLIGIS